MLLTLPILIITFLALFIILALFLDAGDIHFLEAAFFGLMIPSGILILSFLLPILKSPAHSLLCLIGAFILTIILLLYLGMTFIGFSFLIVYIGAVAILFLFVIILFNINEKFVGEGLSIFAKFGLGLALFAIIESIVTLFIANPTFLGFELGIDNFILTTPALLAKMEDVLTYTTTFYNYY
jgi:NADH:ubiquinone oxidoreductase subunit 6 (subunit J)